MRDPINYFSILNQDSSETVAYNNPLFPSYVTYGTLSYYPDYSAVSHWHKDLEFIIVKKGRMTYNVNGELIELTKDNGIMVNSRQLHYGFSAEHNECEYICILLSPELLQGNEWFYRNYIEYITENSNCPYLCLDRSNWTESILNAIEKLYHSFVTAHAKSLPYFESMEAFILIMKILYENLDFQIPQGTTDSSELTSLRSMMTYIEDHYMEHMTLADIAFSGACCKSRCSLLFKKYLRDTPITYTTKLRLRKSLSALLNSDKSITVIAYEYGFGGASYYCETFKKYYGCSPLMYKRAKPPTRITLADGFDQ